MMGELGRRTFLRSSAVGAALSCAGVLPAAGQATGPVQVPTVDRLEALVLIDSSQDIFLAPQKVNGVEAQRARGTGGFPRPLHNEWGLSLLLTSERAGEAGGPRTTLLDFGYTPEALLNNMERLGVDPRRIGTLVLSHGHYDHFGGLVGFLRQHREALPPELTLYAGGEDNFCHRYSGAPGQPAQQLADFGVLDRRELSAQRVNVVLADHPTVISDHAFTTGPIPNLGFERVLPGPVVEYVARDGLGCNAQHFAPAELQGRIVRDEHHHEHATCFNLRDRGLVVITSCGHRGALSSIRKAQEVSGVRKLHALVGGFHLGPAPADYIAQTVAELKELNPDVVIPMHCSGLGFVNAMREQMPDRLVLSSTGTRLIFGGT
ncbi:MBL fold metallo-hydrolase [Falsiroseomonas sp. E2-1-a20]|uniref:MBL fold metallo-hydrolase n=1 Tax=Falsiroseomonas sp. E2-1-a20 TaxID=3239300 RepID=UPI003F2BE9B6